MASLKKRGPVYYIQFYVGTTRRRISTETESFQIAKEKLRQLESPEARGEDSPLPSKTPFFCPIEDCVDGEETFGFAEDDSRLEAICPPASD